MQAQTQLRELDRAEHAEKSYAHVRLSGPEPSTASSFARPAHQPLTGGLAEGQPETETRNRAHLRFVAVLHGPVDCFSKNLSWRLSLSPARSSALVSRDPRRVGHDHPVCTSRSGASAGPRQPGGDPQPKPDCAGRYAYRSLPRAEVGRLAIKLAPA